MCVVCAELRPWSHGCDYAERDGAAQGPDFEPARISSANGSLRDLSPSAIGAKLLTDYWNVKTPRSFDAKAGDTLTYDVSALTSAGRSLARDAIKEWGIVTGLEFKEVTGGFRPSRTRHESGDAAASRSTDARVGPGEAFDGRIGGGDRDWVRFDLPGGKIAEITVSGRGSDALRNPGLTFYDAQGRRVELGAVHSNDKAEATFATTGGGGTYYAQVSGLGGSKGHYRLSLGEPGGRGGADIAFDDDRPGARSEFALSGSRILSADVTISTGWLAKHGTGRDSYSFHTYLHEIGHALGLGHPGDYSHDADFGRHAEYRNDSWQTSVMSYFSQRENPHVDADKAYAVTPMTGDIEAVRELYGARSVRSGDTTYGEGSNAGGMLGQVARISSPVAFTILDTGGSDRLNLSSQRADQRLDLRPGGISDVFGHEGNMVIARGTVIEHAALGSGDDRVIGNDAANTITGGGGDDRIDGGAGSDDLDGGSGADDLRGGTSDDRLRGGSGDDRLEGGTGHDRLLGQSGADRLDGGSSSDDLRGGSGHDVLRGGSGADRLRGGGGDDRLVAGDGSDRMTGQSGDDMLKGGKHRDIMDGGAGNDRIKGGPGPDRIDGGGGRDRIKGGSGGDVIEGGKGNDVLHGGAGDDTFVFRGRFGRDQIRDFEARDDGERIDLSGVGAIRSYADLMDDHVRERGDDVVIDAGKAGQIVLRDVAMAHLDADDFIF